MKARGSHAEEVLSIVPLSKVWCYPHENLTIVCECQQKRVLQGGAD